MKSKILPGFLRMVTICAGSEKVSSDEGKLMSCDTDIRRRKGSDWIWLIKEFMIGSTEK